MAERRAVSGEFFRTRRGRRAMARELRRDLKRRGVLASGAALTVGAVLAGMGPASAATFTVTNTADAGVGSLRQAVLDANGAAGADDIVFDPTVFNTPQTISLLTGQLQTTGPLTVMGPGASLLTVRRDPGAANFRVFDITAAAVPAVTISGVTITGGVSAAGDGGGINCAGAVGQALNVIDSAITGNSATGTNDGGGIAVGANTALTLQRTVVSGNTAGDGGGGIYLFNINNTTLVDSTISGNTAGAADCEGGALYQFGTATVVIRGTTISGNTCLGATAEGGAIFTTSGTPTITIENSTISGNTSAFTGGGFIRSGTTTGTLAITHSTITLNAANGAATSGGGGIFLPTGFAGATLRNTIVSGNTNANTPDMSAGTVNVNFCAVGNATGWTPSGTSGNNLPFGTNLQLGPLQNNGGPTNTHEPAANAPPVNAGDPAFAPPPDFDQRGTGFARVVGGVLDIGAVERNPVPVELMHYKVE
jgi:parallel beta-helix repeat protein